MRVDDALDLFAEHAIGGIVGLLLNAFFARSDIVALDGVNTSVSGSTLHRNILLYSLLSMTCADRSHLSLREGG